MSWLRPDKITPSNYDPQERVNVMVEKYGQLGKNIIQAFNDADPLHCFYGVNVDEYVGYVNKIFAQIGDRDFQTLTNEEINALVRGSFSPDQIAQGFADPADIAELTQKIITLRDAQIE